MRNFKARANLERMLTSGQRLHTMINDVLAWVIEQTRAHAPEGKLVLRTEVGAGVDSLETSLVKLRQILLKLVSNAVKFTEQGEVILSARRSGAYHLAFAVQDTGIGLAADKQQHIFEAFYQVDRSYTRKFGGTRLGLSQAGELTKLLGGKIELASTPGQGSTFRVILPIKT